MKFAEGGNRAIREISGARVAIFNGDTKVAMKLMDQAKADIGPAEKEAPTFTVATSPSEYGKTLAETDEQTKAVNVPVDGQIAFADTFVVTPEKRVRIDKGSEACKKGDRKQAIEELRQGEIDVSYTRLLMPLAPTQKRFDSAMTRVREGRYYESNFPLNVIPDGLIVDSVKLTDTPKKG